MDAFGLVERGLFGQAIIEQRGAGRLVPRDPDGDLEVAAVSQLLGDPRAAEAVGANLGREARLLGATLDHLERTQPKIIEIARWHAAHGESRDVTNTILHEIAHALAGAKPGHGPAWKTVARRIGATPRAARAQRWRRAGGGD